MGNKILVTGGSGFIGTKLVESLRALGNEVSTFSTAQGKDIRNISQVREAIQHKDTVFHLAAIVNLNKLKENPTEAMEINIQGTWNIAEACSRYKAKLYYASTCGVYGNQKQYPITEEAPPNPTEIYTCSKLAGENVIEGFHHTYGLEYIIMRFATIYGEGARPATGIHTLFRQALRNEPITIHGDGKQTRTLTYIDDLISGIIALYKSGKTNGVWNLTTKEEISANQMVKDIKQLTGSKSKVIHTDQRIGQIYKQQISAQKILKDTGWQAKTRWNKGIKNLHNT